MTRLRQYPPGVRRDIRLSRRRDHRRMLRRRTAAVLTATRKVVTNIWFVALVGGVLAGLAVWLLTIG